MTLSKIVIHFHVDYHGEFSIDNIGPCSMDEVYFPAREGTGEQIGSCYKINADGKARFHDVNDICLDSSSEGSTRYSFSRRDPEYYLLHGALDFLHETNPDNYDRSAADFIAAKERLDQDTNVHSLTRIT